MSHVHLRSFSGGLSIYLRGDKSRESPGIWESQKCPMPEVRGSPKVSTVKSSSRPLHHNRHRPRHDRHRLHDDRRSRRHRLPHLQSRGYQLRLLTTAQDKLNSVSLMDTFWTNGTRTTNANAGVHYLLQVLAPNSCCTEKHILR